MNELAQLSDEELRRRVVTLCPWLMQRTIVEDPQNKGAEWARTYPDWAERLAAISEGDLQVILDLDSSSRWLPVELLASKCFDCDPELGMSYEVFDGWLPDDADRATIEAFLDGVFSVDWKADAGAETGSLGSMLGPGPGQAVGQ